MQTIFKEGRFISMLMLLMFLPGIIFMNGCQKTGDILPPGQNNAGGKKKNDPPPPPPPFYFSNCYNPLYSATLVKGTAANAVVSKTYINSPGGSYTAFTSATVNGITISAPAGTFNVGSGTVEFTITGTPLNTGIFFIPVAVGNIQPCQMYFRVLNAPASGPTADPGPTAGSTGVVNFMYKGQSVAYTTVRARDGKIWLQQNLGSPQVAFAVHDDASFGDYFQWGRWDDGHQSPNSAVIAGGTSLMNPAHIPAGNPNFIAGSASANSWWDAGGLATDSWAGNTASSTNGKDPCIALGAGWRMPSAADWLNLKNHEDLEGSLTAYMSNLKLPAAGFRYFQNGESYYWTSTATSNSNAVGLFISDNTYAATLDPMVRAQGNPCRCVKD